MKALTQHAPEPKPAVRRRRKEETGKAFQMAAKKITKRVSVQEAMHRAVAYLWDTLDWLNPWQQETASFNEHDEDLQHIQTHDLSLHL